MHSSLEKVPFKALSWVLSKPFSFSNRTIKHTEVVNCSGWHRLEGRANPWTWGSENPPLASCLCYHSSWRLAWRTARWSWGEWPDVERDLGRLEGTRIREDLSGRNGLLPRCRSFECAQERTCSRRQYFQPLWVANGPFPRGRSDCPVASTCRIRAISITWLQPSWDEEPVSLNPAQCFYFSC